MAERVITFKRGRREIAVKINGSEVVVGSQVYKPMDEKLIRLIGGWIANGFEPTTGNRTLRRPLSPEQRAAVAEAIANGLEPIDVFTKLTQAGVKLGTRVTALRYAMGVAGRLAKGEEQVNAAWEVEPDPAFQAILGEAQYPSRLLR